MVLKLLVNRSVDAHTRVGCLNDLQASPDLHEKIFNVTKLLAQSKVLHAANCMQRKDSITY